ncbi:MAG: hypothetical protein ACJ8GW_01480, partial [Massilia sp.]
VGDQTLSYRNGDNPDPAPLRWRIGMPVHLALRWAENTATVPQADPKDTHMRVTGRTVHYEFSEPWSLLRLLSNYRVSSARGETLHFAVPLSSAAVAGRNAPAAEVLAPAQVFVRLTLLPPNQKSAVAFPRFPIDAPALEGTVLVRARRENLATNQTGGQP